MPHSSDDVMEALRRVPYPGFSRDVVSLGLVREVTAGPAGVVVVLDLGPGNPALSGPIEAAARSAIAEAVGPIPLDLRVRTRAEQAPSLPLVGAQGRRTPAAAGGVEPGLLPGVRRVIAVASGKGGVGKSTVAVNLAAALAARGARTGLLDADIYGPSIPTMMGVRESPRLDEGRKIVPFERHGVRFMSLGFLVDPDAALIWRGPMVMKAIDQLLRDVAWGDLDWLVVDLPPGTGDAQLTLAQKVRLAGAVIVTTPQDVALADAIKGVAMFRKVGVPVLGFVENMSWFVCPHCSHRTEVFDHGGARREAERLGVPFLGEIPLDAAIRSAGDAGAPIAATEPDGPRARAFADLALRIEQALGVEREEPAEQAGLFDRLRRVWPGRGE
jgi:ATP-binding protein involved in chromosome partitioning